jgi:hypothetical protein
VSEANSLPVSAEEALRDVFDDDEDETTPAGDGDERFCF